jgi:hypothetical protein
MKTHVAFVAPVPLGAILRGEKRHEIRCSFRALACREVRHGDTIREPTTKSRSQTHRPDGTKGGSCREI